MQKVQTYQTILPTRKYQWISRCWQRSIPAAQLQKNLALKTTLKHAVGWFITPNILITMDWVLNIQFFMNFRQEQHPFQTNWVMHISSQKFSQHQSIMEEQISNVMNIGTWIPHHRLIIWPGAGPHHGHKSNGNRTKFLLPTTND